MAAGAEEGVVADAPLLQEWMVEGVHAGQPLALGGRVGGGVGAVNGVRWPDLLA